MRNCRHCGKERGYDFVQYEEKELVATAEGGMFPALVLQFCSQECLFEWLRVELRDKE